MGNCLNANEDVGMSQNANSMQATSAGVDTITDAQILAMSTDTNAGLKQKIILNFSCKDLPNLDKGSKSDTFCVLWQLKGKQGTKQKLGMTECIQDNLNPDFVQTIEVDFFFEETQKFIFEVYDKDNETQITNLK